VVSTRNAGWKDISIIDGAKKLNEKIQYLGIQNAKVLDADTFEHENTVFVGATLWTDMDKGDPWVMYQMPNIMVPDSKIGYWHGENGAWERFTSNRWVETHKKHRDYIRLVASQNKDKDIVVITHHLPLTMMNDPNFEGSKSNFYYYSDLSDLILDNENVKLWCAGHSHVNNDFMFEQCRMYMNPVGYYSEHREQEELVKHELLTIGE
jgi:hypothetical protein